MCLLAHVTSESYWQVSRVISYMIYTTIFALMTVPYGCGWHSHKSHKQNSTCVLGDNPAP